MGDNEGWKEKREKKSERVGGGVGGRCDWWLLQSVCKDRDQIEKKKSWTPRKA